MKMSKTIVNGSIDRSLVATVNSVANAITTVAARHERVSSLSTSSKLNRTL